MLGALLGVLPVGAQPGMRLDPEKAITQLHHTAWTIDHGLPQDRINTLAQTPDGYLWLGTQEGLVRFDGVRFQLFDKQHHGLASNLVSALTVDRSGALWVGTRGGGLSRYADGRFTSYRAADGLNSDEIAAVVEDRDGALWVGTTLAGLSRYADGQFTSYRAADGLASENVNTLYADRGGNLWIGTRDAGLIRFNAGRFHTYDETDGLPSADVVSILEDRQGNLWIGTRGGGLCRLKDGRIATFTTRDGLPSNTVLSLAEDVAGSLWVGTDRGGLARYARGVFSTFSEAHGLTSGSVLDLLEDHEGGLWIATPTGGLNRLHAGKFTLFTTKEGLGHDGVFSMTQAADGAMWFGTNGGGVSRLDDGRLTTWRAADGLPTDFVLSVYGARDGSVWIGTQDAGAVRWKDGRFRTFTTRDGLPELSIYGVYETADGTVLLGTGRSGLARYRDGVFTTLTTADGLSSNSVTAMVEGRDGTLWIGTYDGGLNQLVDGKVTARYGAAEGLLNDYVLALYEDAEGVLWIGTRGGGLARLKDGRLRSITTAEGLLSDLIFTIQEDGADNFWLTCNRGLVRVPLADLRAVADGRADSVRSQVFDRSDGLLTNEFLGGVQPAGWTSRDGHLWFPTSRGVVSIDPQEIPLNAVPPPVVVQSAAAKGIPVGLRGQTVLAPGHDALEVHYAGLSFLAPERVRYRYRLVGIDEGWVDAGARREAFYTSLAPGAYTFEVMASNNDGVWSQAVASVTFYLEPRYYQTVWFYLLCAFGLVLGGFGAYRLRVRSLTARQRELEGLVEERTADLRSEKEKTEQAKAVIEEQAEKLRELDQMKTRFFSNVSHEFRTPLTLNIGPLENALAGFYGPLAPELRKQTEIMLRNARRLLRLINQLLDLSKLDSGKMKLRVEHRNLVAFVEGVVLSFTPFTERKNIALTFETEADELPLAFDPEGLEKVFFNLLSNAVKFTPEGGHVEVQLRPGVERDGRAGIEVRVHDSGIGIPAGELPHIFDRFHQVDGVVSQVQEGTGIGLALVKELVDLHAGRIDVESVPAQGTTFTVWLPLGIEHLPAAEPLDDAGTPAQPVARGPMVEMAVLDEEETLSGDGTPAAAPVEGIATIGPRPRLLVVDDNPDIRDYLQSCLTAQYAVTTAKHGREALEHAHRAPPDLILSDVMMPYMDGYALCRAVRAETSLRHIPFILLTSKASIDDKIEGLEAGADDYLAKPFNAHELLARVQNLLKLRAHEKALQEAIESKSQVLRIAAHDLRNPLNSIREFSKIIKEGFEEGTDEMEMLDLIERASNQMLDLISQMLEAEALESGALEIRREPVQVNSVAALVVKRNRRMAERKGQRLHLSMERAEGGCVVLANEEWLAEAMENLVCNAIKYSPPGKPVHVVVERVEGAVRFAVRDEGPGLTEDDQRNLFKKFQRLSARPTAGEPSTGLGLSIVKRIVEMHDGHVWAESEPGHGSTFVFELPLEPVAFHAGEPGPAPAREPMGARETA